MTDSADNPSHVRGRRDAKYDECDGPLWHPLVLLIQREKEVPDHEAFSIDHSLHVRHIVDYQLAVDHAEGWREQDDGE